jgi:hypothetical protein
MKPLLERRQDAAQLPLRRLARVLSAMSAFDPLRTFGGSGKLAI